jgi:ribulose 1,5-bisphosphate carboxylase large subunit-like protein
MRKTDETTLYSVNITDNHDRIFDNALRAIDAGANALMVNIFLGPGSRSQTAF